MMKIEKNTLLFILRILDKDGKMTKPLSNLRIIDEDGKMTNTGCFFIGPPKNSKTKLYINQSIDNEQEVPMTTFQDKRINRNNVISR